MADTPVNGNRPEDSGWTRRFTACEPRLSEAVQLYRESGFEVLLMEISMKESHLTSQKQDEKSICRECFREDEENCRIIYTRLKK